MATPHASQPRLLLGGLVLLALLTGCAGRLGGLPAVSPALKTTSTALDADTDTRLARSITPLAAAHPGRSGFYLLGNGIEALAARLLLASRAERSIDRMHNKSMTFDNQATIVGGRNIGDEYFDARADMNYNDLDVFAVGPVAQEVSRAFDDYWNSATAVPVAALVGAPKGPQALERLRAFITAEADEARRTTYRAAFETSLSELLAFGADSVKWEPWTLAVDPVEKAQRRFDPRRSALLTAQLRPTAEAAETEFVLVSPYFVPQDRGVELFRRMRQRGVRVVIVTNSLSSTDVSPLHAGYSRSRKALLEAGVELWEIREDPARRDRQRRGLGHSASSLHTKAFAVDRRHLFVGSFNFDPRSADINTEMGIVVDSPSLAAPAVEGMLATLATHAYRLRLDAGGDIEWVAQENGAEVVYRNEPHTGFWRRFQVGVLRLLPIDGQL